jgi:hypothetical protein
VAVDRGEDGDTPRRHLEGLGSPDQPAPTRPTVLADPERRAAESRLYFALVERVFSIARDTWSEAAPQLRTTWESIKAKYEHSHSEETEPTSQTEDGSWRGKGGRTLDAGQNAEIDRGYVRICEVGERAIVPRIVAVEAGDPTRTLAGFEHRIKGEGRVKEKVADLLEASSTLSASDAFGAVVDVVRFTFAYRETRYTQGVLADVDRLKAEGFVLGRLKNTWQSDQYKGVNSQWLEPKSGVRFEVQFHTQASLEGKELTHKAYERIRVITERTPAAEQEAAELEAFQGKVNAIVPVPPDVSIIEDYRREQRDD